MNHHVHDAAIVTTGAPGRYAFLAKFGSREPNPEPKQRMKGPQSVCGKAEASLPACSCMPPMLPLLALRTRRIPADGSTRAVETSPRPLMPRGFKGIRHAAYQEGRCPQPAEMTLLGLGGFCAWPLDGNRCRITALRRLCRIKPAFCGLRGTTGAGDIL